MMYQITVFQNATTLQCWYCLCPRLNKAKEARWVQPITRP